MTFVKHNLFVTQQTYRPNTGAANGFYLRQGADQICQDEATAAGLSGTWVAILSDSRAARSVIEIRGSIFNLNGDVLSTASTFWSNDLLNPVGYMSNGQAVDSSNSLVWTGTAMGGTPSTEDCNEWTEGQFAQSSYGNAVSAQQWLSHGGFASCAQNMRFYCIDQ